MPSALNRLNQPPHKSRCSKNARRYPAAALGDEALGKRGEGCRASPLLRRDRTVQTLAKVYEDRADEFSRAAQQTDDPVFCRLLLMLALQWKLAAQGEAKSKDASTSLASTQPQP